MRISQEIREKFIKYFVGRGHLHLPSASLVPSDDPTLLFTTAGMVPFKPYFLGQGTPPAKRITTIQKCFRTTDIEKVGFTPRHLTFLEMLGNFSLGDYFKKEAIEFAYEFLIKELQLPLSSIWISIFEEDDEAFEIWNKHIGIPAERIVRLGKEDNFWGPPGPTGPCGPCSEIYYDFGPKNKGEENCKPGDPCDRFMEIWNLVFMTYYMDEEGKLTPLPQKNIDTGMGLERITTIVEEAVNVFDTDLFQPLIQEIRKLINQEDRVIERIISDHIRGITFLMGDGVVPTNDGRGYVLRRLIRRAERKAFEKGIKEPFLYNLVPKVIEIMKSFYPELVSKKDFIMRILKKEEEQFLKTLEQGLYLLDTISREGITELSGDFVFRLYDTYGFPLELTLEIAQEKGWKVDLEGFNKAMEEQKRKARISLEEKLESIWINLSDEEIYELREIPPTEFVGYDVLETKSKVLFFLQGKHGRIIKPSEEIYLILDKTPFYAESGGQVADKGVIVGEDVEVVVNDVQKLGEKFYVHKGRVVKGELEEGMEVIARVDKESRESVQRHHTATHLLHYALRKTLGNHVMQSGSLVSPEFLRFDFTHYQPLTFSEIEEIERIINSSIVSNYKVEKIYTTLEKAREMGALALFTEKYQREVRVIKINDISMELCGGTHVEYTGDIGLFIIVKEEGIGSGIRRVFALCGLKAWEYINSQKKALNDIYGLLRVNNLDDLNQRLVKILSSLEEKDNKIKNLENIILEYEAKRILERVISKDNVNIFIEKVNLPSIDLVRRLGDYLKSKKPDSLIILGIDQEDKTSINIMISPSLVKKGILAKDIANMLNEKLKGKGGGRDTFAQINIDKIDNLKTIEKILTEWLEK
ncbi:MAG: alanine--tRNA ligase [Dictyoglomus sp.]|nr:alanine--tRNA ligase [Dictyoglomus sp.]MCX7941810.1 alanine--tRNA ligase [Dictyoglomaceae bacterium]MDW8188087.1 alanine--tRNA ligase [Dictyoglomus sp.]